MDATTRKTLALVALLLTGSGCLGPSIDEARSGAPDPGLDDGNRTQQVASEDGQHEPEDRGNDTEEPGPRTIPHAMGETTIRGSTDRVVALEFNHVENLLALGLQPVGVADEEGYREWVGVGGLDPAVEDVGTRAEPSLETIADLEPDLILAIEFRHQGIYGELSRIAPTLVFEGFPSEEGTDQYDRMLSIFERTAQATALETQAQRVLDDMDERFEDVQRSLEQEDQAGREILVAQVFTYNDQPLARVFLDGSIPANVADRIGLENAWTKTACSTGYGYCDVSKEGFADVQHADFFYQAQRDDDPVQDAWSDDPVWNSYEFVQEDRVYALGEDAWMFGGPLVNQELADRIAQHLTGG